jgi:hypothetical protein
VCVCDNWGIEKLTIPGLLLKQKRWPVWSGGPPSEGSKGRIENT